MHFLGTTTIKPVGLGACLLEAGEVTVGAHRGPARRGLTLRRVGEGRLGLLFEDGRPFVELDLSGGSARAVHACGEDIYELALELTGTDRILERWRVRGPAKGYDALTHWQRAEG